MSIAHRIETPPRSVCVLRLSAIGDTCHAAAALRALQRAWPDCRFTWLIGRIEAKLMTALFPEVEFITFDKGHAAADILRLRRELRPRRFDLLIDLQLSLRASLVSLCVRAPVKLGFDRARARELQLLFTNARIEPASREHVLDSFLGFVRACGVPPGKPRWDLELPAAALDYARRLIPDGRATLVISPCSSHPLRNWPAARYARVAEHAAVRHGMRVIVAGGRSRLEAESGAAIVAASREPVINQVGRDTLPEMLALLARATVLLTPDSGPAHMATMVNLPVIGLYAATRSERAGPYLSRCWCVDKYDAAARMVYGKPASQIPWTRKIERPGVMELIEVDEVNAKLDTLMGSPPPSSGKMPP